MESYIFTILFILGLDHAAAEHGTIKCDQFVSEDYEDLCGLSIEPTTVGSMSDLKIASYVHAYADTHNYLHYPNDCILINFDVIQDYEDESPGDYVPVPNEITCEFTLGNITCQKINGTQILLKVEEHFDLLEGTISQIQNPWSDHTLVVSHIVVFEGCTDDTIFDVELGDDITPGPYNLETTPALIEDAQFTFQSDVLGEINNVTISFTPATLFLDQQGSIKIVAPKLYTDFDTDSKSYVDKYPFSDELFGCKSSSFSSMDKTKGEGFYLITYDQFVGTQGDQIVIECHNWINPVIPQAYEGLQIQTTDKNLYIIDASADISIDATYYNSMPLDDSLITYEFDVVYPGEYATYTISAQTEIPIDVNDDCYVKITFPSELDARRIDLTTIYGTGLLLDSEGKSTASILKDSMLEDDDHENNYIVLQGCQFDPSGKSDDDLVNFSKNEFSVTIQNIMNPHEDGESTSPFKIEIFKYWIEATFGTENQAYLHTEWREDLDSEPNLLSRVTYSDTSFIDSSKYEHENGHILHMTITTSIQEIGVYEGNIATITFTPDQSLPTNNGIIEIYTPAYSETLNSNTNQIETEYPISQESLLCESEHFSSFIQTVSENTLSLAYSEYSGEDLEEVVITCTNWRNPSSPYEQFGYTLKTFNKNAVQIDHSIDTPVDANGYTGLTLDDEDITYDVSYPYVMYNAVSDYTISFKSSISIDSDGGCFVKYVFPEQFDLSSWEDRVIEGSGLFTQADGSFQTEISYEINWENTNTIVVEGCNFDLQSATSDQLTNFESDVFTITFKDVPNPVNADDFELSAFEIAVYRTSDFHLQDLTQLIIENTSFKIPVSVFGFPDVITDISITSSIEILGAEDSNIIQIEFTPISQLAENGIIKLTVPYSFSQFDSENEIVETIYPMGSDDFACLAGDQFESVNCSTVSQYIIIDYTGFNQESTVVIQIQNMMNPKKPLIHEGFALSVSDKDGQPLEGSMAFSLDTTNFEPYEIEESQVSIELSNTLTRQTSDYTIEIILDVSLEYGQECQFSITFPDEIDIKDLNSIEYEASGLLLDSGGNSQSLVLTDNLSQTISITGCEFDPVTSDLTDINYQPDLLSLTFYDLPTPQDFADTSPFNLELSQDGYLFQFSDSITLKKDQLVEYEGATLVSVVADNQAIAGLSTIVFDFNIEKEMQSNGKVKIYVPKYQSTWDAENEQVVEWSAFSESDVSCNSDSLDGVQFSVEGLVATISYGNVQESQSTSSISITCSQWTNPFYPEEIAGFRVEMYGSDDKVLVLTNFGVDASNYEGSSIDEEVSYEIGTALYGEESSYKLSFTSDVPIESGDECYVKYIFPSELDLRNVEITQIEGSGMFVDENGQNQTSIAIDSNINDDDQPEKYILLKGCAFDISDKASQDFGDFVQNEFTITVLDVMNPIDEVDTSNFIIEVYKSINEQNEAVGLITTSNTLSLPHTAWEHDLGQIYSISITSSDQTLGVEQGNEATIQFDLATRLPQESGFIEIQFPVWYQFYDQIKYPFEADNFECSCDKFDSFELSEVSETILTYSYEGYLGVNQDTLSIVCQNWRNPVAPVEQYGFVLKTYSGRKKLIDHSIEFYQDATSYTGQTIETSSVSLEMTISFAAEASDYTIDFTSSAPIDSTNGCFVKYTFPAEIDVTGIDLENIQTSGMFIDSQGDSVTEIVDSNLVDEPHYVILSGCNLDASNTDAEQRVEGFFSVTFPNVINPDIEGDSSEFLIEIFNEWDSDESELREKITSTDNFKILESAYLHEGQEITDQEMTTSSSILGDSEGNILTIKFTPASSMPQQSGFIELDMPIWVTVYDSDTQQVVNKYQSQEDNFECSSEYFDTIDQVEALDYQLSLKYTNYNSTEPQQITITCQNWRNPLAPNSLSGYLLKTFSSSKQIIDQTEYFSFDASNLLPFAIDPSSFAWQLENNFVTKDSDYYRISFETEYDVSSKDGCFIKYTFPDEIDVSNIDLNYIEGESMMGDGDTFESESVDSNVGTDDGQQKWVVVEGCLFDLSSVDSLQEFEQNMFEVVFYDLINPEQENTMFPFQIEIFKEWDYDNREGSGLIAYSDSLEFGGLKPVPIFIVQDGSSSEQNYMRTVVTMDTEMETFEANGGASKFEEDVATSLGIPKEDVKVISLESGSVIADYNIYVTEDSEYSLDELIALQQHAFANGLMDLGYPVTDVTISTGTGNGASLSVVSDGEAVQLEVWDFLKRDLDPESNDDNCVKCLVQNEGISQFGQDSELWAGSSSENFVFTVFCEKQDLSASKCCKAAYDQNQNFIFVGESANDPVCMDFTSICSHEKVQKKPKLDNYFKMYEQCIQIEDRMELDALAEFTQFKGQGSNNLVCRDSGELKMNKFTETPDEYILSKTNPVQDEVSASSLCLLNVKTETPGSVGYYQLNITNDYMKSDSISQQHYFYLVDNDFLDQKVIDVTPISIVDDLTISFDMNYKYSILAIMDLTKGSVYTNLNFGPQILQKDVLECSIRFQTTLTEFESKGGQEAFIGTLSAGLAIGDKYIEITEIREGSVIVDYNLQTDLNQELTLIQLSQRMRSAIKENSIDFGFPILDFSQGGESLIDQPVTEAPVLQEVKWYQNPFYQIVGGICLLIILITICVAWRMIKSVQLKKNVSIVAEEQQKLRSGHSSARAVIVNQDDIFNNKRNSDVGFDNENSQIVEQKGNQIEEVKVNVLSEPKDDSADTEGDNHELSNVKSEEGVGNVGPLNFCDEPEFITNSNVSKIANTQRFGNRRQTNMFDVSAPPTKGPRFFKRDWNRQSMVDKKNTFQLLKSKYGLKMKDNM